MTVLEKYAFIVEIASKGEHENTVFALLYLVTFHIKIPIKNPSWITVTVYYRYRFFFTRITQENSTREQDNYEDLTVHRPGIRFFWI